MNNAASGPQKITNRKTTSDMEATKQTTIPELCARVNELSDILRKLRGNTVASAQERAQLSKQRFYAMLELNKMRKAATK